MVGSEIKIDKDGIWYYRGAHMFRKEILSTFFEHLKMDDCGEYFIELNEEIYFLDVEDTAFVVTAVCKTKAPSNGHEQLVVKISDDCMEPLDLDTLTIGKNNIMYCRIKDRKFPARFMRKSYYQLAEFIEEDGTDNTFYIVLNHRKYLIRNS